MQRPLLLRRVIGKSMAPKLRPGQLILATTIIRKLKPGQVIILEKNDKQLIKRIERIEQDKLFVIGDNPDASTDSRHFGWLEKRYVVARVKWPKLAK
ncbi:MAG: putative peptidase family protein [Candidatus Saccharibacteria bacterium]|nr:putative peptidase family protein [Candidatus Saccharibacteria bacterium]